MKAAGGLRLAARDNRTLVRAYLDGAELARHDRHDAVMLISLASRHGVCPLDGQVMSSIREPQDASHETLFCSCGFKVKA